MSEKQSHYFQGRQGLLMWKWYVLSKFPVQKEWIVRNWKYKATTQYDCTKRHMMNMPIPQMPLRIKNKQSWLHRSDNRFCICGTTFFKGGNMLFEKKDHKYE